MSLIDNELNPEEDALKAETKRDELRENGMKFSHIGITPAEALGMLLKKDNKRTIVHINCDGKDCPHPPKEVGELEQDWEREFSEKFFYGIHDDVGDDYWQELKKFVAQAHEQGRLKGLGEAIGVVEKLEKPTPWGVDDYPDYNILSFNAGLMSVKEALKDNKELRVVENKESQTRMKRKTTQGDKTATQVIGERLVEVGFDKEEADRILNLWIATLQTPKGERKTPKRSK